MFDPVHPVRPAAPYVGGKKRLSRRLASMIGAIDHRTYAEVFVGMGGPFFAREMRPPVEVINDRSRDVANFFRILQRHYVAFMDMLRFQITSRAGFERLLAVDPETLTDLERAARFVYLQRLSFGGKVAGRNFGIAPTTPARFDVTKLGPVFEAIHERLAPVWIECLDYADFIARWDRPATLFYLDPPYHGSEDDYGKGMFARSDFVAMADQLSSIKGRFLMSINDHPDIRKAFARFNILEVPTKYQLAGMGRLKPTAELVISNAR